MTRYAKRKLKYSRNENFNLLPYVEWDRFVTLTGAQAEWGLRYRIYVIRSSTIAIFVKFGFVSYCICRQQCCNKVISHGVKYLADNFFQTSWTCSL